MGYYLIARDKTSNDFKILELKSKWYLKNGTDALSRSNKLEVIDLITTRFNSREEMANKLVQDNYIPNNNYDFFIQERVTIDDGYNDEVFYQYVSRDIDPSEYEDKDEYREKISDIACDMNDEERIYAMLDESGYNFDIEEIVRFIDDNDINDLHAGNWGVTADGFTVMVDYSGY